MRHSALALMILCTLGCGSGTDVGNPTTTEQPSTTRDDFLGTYQVSIPVASIPAEPIVQEGALSTCTTQTGTTRRIDAGATAGAVTLSGIFGYTGIADPIAGTVTNGSLAIDASGSATRLVCTGTLSLATLAFTCEVTVGETTAKCQLTLEQQ